MIRRAKTNYLNAKPIMQADSKKSTTLSNDFDITPSQTLPSQPTSFSGSLMDVISSKETQIETEISRLKAMIYDISNLENELIKVRAAKAALMGISNDNSISQVGKTEQKTPRRKRTSKKDNLKAETPETELVEDIQLELFSNNSQL